MAQSGILSARFRQLSGHLRFLAAGTERNDSQQQIETRATRVCRKTGEIRSCSPAHRIKPGSGSPFMRRQPGRLNSPRTLSRFHESTDADSSDLFIEEKGVISEEKVNSCRDCSDHGLVRPRERRSRSVSAVRTRPRMSLMGCKVSVNDDDSDTDSTLSSVSSSNSKRKSWTQSEILEVKEIFDSSNVGRNDVKKPVPRSRSANVSPVRSLRHDTSDEYSILNRGRRDVRCTRKYTKGSETVKNLVPKAISEQNSHPLSSLIHDVKGAETGISWTSLPAALVKLGKEVVRQRDLAASAAADALQEACAAERLLKTLSAYSELNTSEGVVDLQTYVDKFSNLQRDLNQNKLIIQSLTKISPFKTSSETTDANNISPHSVKETLDTALRRNKNATTWIKSAVSLDLSPNNHNPANASSPNGLKKSNRGVRPKEPKGPKGPSSFMIRKQRSIDDIPHMLITDKDAEGSSLLAATELGNAIQDGCRKLFLDYLEKYLDEFERKMKCGGQTDREIAELMCKIKRVNDLLVLLAGKEPNSNLEECERVAYGRAREKIYGILLSNIERTLSS